MFGNNCGSREDLGKRRGVKKLLKGLMTDLAFEDDFLSKH